MSEDILRGSKLPQPRFQSAPLSPGLQTVQGYRNLQTFFPTLTKLFRLSRWTSDEEIWMDTRARVVALDCSGTTGPCTVDLVANQAGGGTAATKVTAFLKTTHLLDPIQWMRGVYSLPKESGLPWHHRAWLRAWQKLQDPGNQAYIDAIACYALGKLREEGLSPHFNRFYGAFCARATTYRYNLTEDFKSFRHERWFWRNKRKSLFQLHVTDGGEPADEELLKTLLEEPETFSDDEADEESLDDVDVETPADLGELESADSMSDVSVVESSEEESGNTDATDDEEEADDALSIYAEFKDFPVMLILSERNEGTMDSLFDAPDEVGCARGEAGWEERWSAWLFQVVAALSCAQTLIGFTHNDLHTNNIVWSRTSEEFLYYRSRAGNVYRVPTFGKVFRLIDFGRGIFTINGHRFISDDFKNGNDAEGQYAFAPIVQKFEKEVPPNPSFDLCRLAVSMMDGVFASVPETRADGAVLSDEPGMTVHETVSDLYNLLWCWMLDDEGRSIFINPDGSERFPDFDLYKHIAAHVFKAIPAQQFNQKAFDGYSVAASDVPATTKVYSLFS